MSFNTALLTVFVALLPNFALAKQVEVTAPLIMPACSISYFNYNSNGDHLTTLIDDDHFNRIPHLMMEIEKQQVSFAVGSDIRRDALLEIKGSSIYLRTPSDMNQRIRIGDTDVSVLEHVAKLPPCPLKDFVALDYAGNARGTLAQPIKLATDLKVELKGIERKCIEQRFAASKEEQQVISADSDKVTAIPANSPVVFYNPRAIYKFEFSGSANGQSNTLEIVESKSLHNHPFGFLEKRNCEAVVNAKVATQP